MCVCVRACVRACACVRVRVRACVCMTCVCVYVSVCIFGVRARAYVLQSSVLITYIIIFLYFVIKVVLT